MIENAAKMGEYFQEQLAEISRPYIQEVRGKGLLIGVELKTSAGGARRFCEALASKGVLAKETHEHVIRFTPPLIITRETLDWAIPIIRGVFND
jgi:ornithine--oxo-acid transaminase